MPQHTQTAGLGADAREVLAELERLLRVSYRENTKRKIKGRRHPHNRLTDKMVRQAGPGRHADSGGLYLYVRPNGTRSWVQRIVVDGRREDHGLGPCSDVSLADAREIAAANRRAGRKGRNPFAARAARVEVKSVREVFDAVVENRRGGWRNPATKQKWRRLFRQFIAPMIGDKPVDQVTVDDVVKIVLPQWG